jgi:tRNA A-37 threonylcarbamoyl transferase component Bud32
VSKLLGIVVAGDDGEMVMGMLMTFITVVDLRSPTLHRRVNLHKKWEEQVTAVVQELHTHDIVWGDGNPSNIIMDEAMDAWLSILVG